MTLNVLTILLIFLLLFLGCGNDQTGPVTVRQEYTFDITDDNGIQTEYQKYLLKRGEFRNIWVGGKLTANLDRYTNVWWENNYNYNQNDKKKRAEINPANNLYFQSLIINSNDLDGVSGNVTFTVSVGTTQNASRINWQTTVTLIESRNYLIEYNCQGPNYDLYTLGYDFENSLKNAFMLANTEIGYIYKHDLNIPPYNQIDVRTERTLMTYGDIWASRGQNHNPKIGVLFGVQNYSGSGGAVGKSCRDTVQGRSYGFVFIERIEQIYGNRYEQDKKVLRTRAAIHEMSHVRRSKGSVPEWNGDIDHFFHNGKGKDSCIFQQRAVWKPENALKFCEGHEQIFLNINWD